MSEDEALEMHKAVTLKSHDLKWVLTENECMETAERARGAGSAA